MHSTARSFFVLFSKRKNSDPSQQRLAGFSLALLPRFPTSMLRDPFEHAALVQRIQSECFAEDIEPPADSLGWTEEELHAFFESGGDELPLRFAETPGVPVRIIPAGMRARVFVISDMHCDHAQNFGWIQG